MGVASQGWLKWLQVQSTAMQMKREPNRMPRVMRLPVREVGWRMLLLS